MVEPRITAFQSLGKHSNAQAFSPGITFLRYFSTENRSSGYFVEEVVSRILLMELMDYLRIATSAWLLPRHREKKSAMPGHRALFLTPQRPQIANPLVLKQAKVSRPALCRRAVF
jgi:hypothetical protein